MWLRSIWKIRIWIWDRSARGGVTLCPKRDRPSDTAQRWGVGGTEEEEEREEESRETLLCQPCWWGKVPWMTWLLSLLPMTSFYIVTMEKCHICFCTLLLTIYLLYIFTSVQYCLILSVCVSPERPMPGQKVRLQTRPLSLLCTSLKSPGRLLGNSPPTSTNQVTFKDKPSYTTDSVL